MNINSFILKRVRTRLMKFSDLILSQCTAEHLQRQHIDFMLRNRSRNLMRVKGIFIFTTTAVYENTVNLCNGSSQNVPVLVKSVISEINSSIAVPKVSRGHPGSNQGPLDLQSNALPLSYIPMRSFVQIIVQYPANLISEARNGNSFEQRQLLWAPEIQTNPSMVAGDFWRTGADFSQMLLQTSISSRN